MEEMFFLSYYIQTNAVMRYTNSSTGTSSQRIFLLFPCFDIVLLRNENLFLASVF